MKGETIAEVLALEVGERLRAIAPRLWLSRLWLSRLWLSRL